MAGLVKAEDLKKIREVDFVQQFTHSSLAKLIEVLGVTRKIPISTNFWRSKNRINCSNYNS